MQVYIIQIFKSVWSGVLYWYRIEKFVVLRQFNRKYKDYVYRKMLVQEYLKKWRIFKRV